MTALPYSEALAWIQSHVDYSRTHLENIAPENFNLARMEELMARLGNPHIGPPTIHIAGTKGKGSTAAFCASALRRCGLYTSPELENFRERIRVDFEPISEEDFASVVAELQPHAAAIPGLTAYELQTAVAFMYFRRKETRANVIEVGLGGRLDSTNVVQPALCIITHISMDHMAVLGNTLEEIAAEKGGIIKPGVPVVIAPQPPEAMEVLQNIAKQRGCDVYHAGASYSRLGQSLIGQVLQMTIRYYPPEHVEIPLLGPHQAANAGTAYLALRVLFIRNILPVSLISIHDGFMKLKWPGRFEVLQTEPPLVLDGAHNRASAKVIMQTYDELFAGQPLALLFGASEDKDIQGMFAELLPKTRWLILMQANHPRAADRARLAELAAAYDVEVFAPEGIPAAVAQALALAQAHGGVALATGSLYPLGAVKAAWRARGEDKV